MFSRPYQVVLPRVNHFRARSQSWSIPERSRSIPTTLEAMSDKVFRLVTVNTVPERAKRLIGRVVEDVKDRYTIVHVANVESEYVFFCMSQSC